MDASNWKLDPSTNIIFTSIFLCGCDQWLDLYTNIFTLHGIFFHTCVEVLLGDVEFPLILDNSFNLFPESLFNFMTKAGTMSSNFSNILLLEFSFPSVRSSVRPFVPFFYMHHTYMQNRYMPHTYPHPAYMHHVYMHHANMHTCIISTCIMHICVYMQMFASNEDATCILALGSKIKATCMIWICILRM